MLTNLKDRLLGVALVGSMWLGSQAGCDPHLTYVGSLVGYDAVADHVIAPAVVDYGDYGCCGSDYSFGFYYDEGY